MAELEYRRNAARILAEQPAVRASVTGATLHFDRSRARGYGEINADAWRRWAEAVKSHTLTHLDRYLDEAQRNLEAHGVQVHWAATAADVHDTLHSIVARNAVKRVVKGKSMLSEELGVNEMLEAAAVEVFETDLGEYILQLLHETPSHILGPAIHRSLDEIRQLFHERFDTPLDASPDALAAAARRVLRQAFVTADMGITGGNFLVAETGTLALIENEGNIRLSTSAPRVHVALVGIEKLLPRWSDLAPFLQLTARAATGQGVGTFVSLIQGPRRFAADAAGASAADEQGVSRARAGDGAGEPDGPDQVHVILVDNGRTRVLADPAAWEALRCVRCGACLNVCPVYRQTGGHAYGWVYSGPIGAILDPGLLGLEAAAELPFASTLCGACADVCPVRIPIPRLLLEWRARAVDAGLRPPGEKRMIAAYAAAATRPAWFRAAGTALRLLPGPLRAALPVLRDWSGARAVPEPSPAAFGTLWRRESRKVAEEPAGTVARPGAAPEPTPPTVTEDTGPRRAFAGGRLTRPPQGEDRAAGAANAVSDRHRVPAAVAEALSGRTRLVHPGLLQASNAVAAPPETAASTEGETGGADGNDVVAWNAVQAFMERFRANGGEAVRFSALQEAHAWLCALCADFASACTGVGVPEELSPASCGRPGTPPVEAELGVSLARQAAAATGTVLLDSREGRLTQLLVPTHLVWVREATIRATLAEALDAVRHDLPAALGLHSGPSRSADIGRVLVTGVHGPGRVIAAIIP